ncbi:unnamed protein product [Owenia fusiformis]|uniref:Speckle targeted PIP5K1A-regulated poly(A) polymerase n=1 Tax=Owenia fusiformis TaxID=6347 RepID=A0A8J1U861_OWEFU|nr:unnamed protein product [Owenia fusiformis]
MALKCDVCNVPIPSDDCMGTHVKGRRHVQLALLQAKQRDQAEKSLYVRGFHKKTKESDLKNYFLGFGPVNKVFIENKKGNYAIIEFHQKQSATKALEQKPHHIGQYTIEVKPRRFNPPKARNNETSKAREAAVVDPSIQAAQASSKALLMEKLQKCSDVAGQMECLKSELELTEGDVQLRCLICDMLQTIFVEFFPGCEVHQFGSSVNGFGVIGCDMDIFIDLNLDKNISQPGTSRSGQMPYVGDIKLLRGKNGLLSRDELKRLPQSDLIRLVSRILQQCAQGCKNIITVTNARCPVVKFDHEPSGLQCDITINNRIGLQNTKLLQEYCKIFPLLRVLIFTVRYYFKLKELSRSEKMGPQLSNYALCMLVLFYLQTQHNLPTVETLQKQAGIEEHCVIDDWECGFSTSIEPVTCTQPIDSLLAGLFEFYINFDFNSLVICPLTGKTKLIADFFDKDKLPDKLKNFKVMPMCVQDPFVLNHNIAATINDKTRTKIIAELSVAHRKCQSEIFSKPQVDDSWGLTYLLSGELPPGGVSATTAMSIQLPLATQAVQVVGSSLSLNPATFPINLPGCNVMNEFTKALLLDPNGKHVWCQRVCRFVHKVMENVLGFTCIVKSQHGLEEGQLGPNVNTLLNPAGGSVCKEGDSDKTTKRLSPDSDISNNSKKSKLDNSCTVDAEVSDMNNTGDRAANNQNGICGNIGNSDQISPSCPTVIKVASSNTELLQAMFNTSESGQKKVDTIAEEQSKDSEDSKTLNDSIDNTKEISLTCTNSFGVWENRKKVRQKILREKQIDDSLELEKLITQYIMKDSARKCTIPVEFTICLKSNVGSTNSCVNVEIKDTKGHTSSFLGFIKPYLIRIINRYLD